MDEREFNLLTEAWIPVVDRDGKISEVSLTDAFANAHEYRSFAGDVPPQDAVLLRLMLTVLYSVYLRRSPSGDDGPLEDEGSAVERWSELWERGSFDMDMIGQYLEGYRDRFYLFDPERPFFQCHLTKGTEYSAAKLNGKLSESENRLRLFSSVNGVRKSTLTYREAARWLLYLNAFDDTSSKPTVRGEKMPKPGIGWLGKLGLVMAVGDNLFQTLMLNFVLADEDGTPLPDGMAFWELDSIRADERVEVPLPNSPQGLLTLQNRRIMLNRENGLVTGYRLLGGDVVPKENALVEQMTAWYLKDNIWHLRRHDPARVMWRDFSSLMMRSSLDTGRREPGVVRWLSVLIDDEVISSPSINIRVTGIKYGDKDAYVDDIIDDSLSVNASLLSNLGEGFNYAVDSTIIKTDKCVYILGYYAADIANLTGADKFCAQSASEVARSRGFSLLDLPFRHWLASVDPKTDDMDTKLNEWDTIMETILIEEGRSMLESSGTRAMVGKMDDEGNIVNSFTVFRKFRHSIYKHTRRQVDE